MERAAWLFGAAQGSGKTLTLQLLVWDALPSRGPACARRVGGVEEARFGGKEGEGGEGEHC